MPVALDIERAAPDQQRCEDIVDDGADSARHVESFAKTDQALVGMDAQPHRIGLLVDPDRLKPGDFHPNLSVQKIAGRYSLFLLFRFMRSARAQNGKQLEK